MWEKCLMRKTLHENMLEFILKNIKKQNHNKVDKHAGFLTSPPQTLTSLHVYKPLLRWSSATLQQSLSSSLMHLSSYNLHLLQRRKRHQLNLAVRDGVRSLGQAWQSTYVIFWSLKIIISSTTCLILCHVLQISEAYSCLHLSMFVKCLNNLQDFLKWAL